MKLTRKDSPAPLHAYPSGPRLPEPAPGHTASLHHTNGYASDSLKHSGTISEELPGRRFRRGEVLTLILGSLLLGIVTDTLVRQEQLGLNFLLFVGLWVVACLAAMFWRTQRSLRTPLVYASLATVNAWLVFWRASPLVQFWSVVIALTTLAMLATTVFVVNYRELPLVDRVSTLVKRIQLTVQRLPKDLSAGLSQRSTVHRQVNRGVVGAVGLALIFTTLFVSADQVLGQSFSWVGNALRSLGDFIHGYNMGRLFTVAFWTVASMSALRMLVQPLPAESTDRHIAKTLTQRDANTMLWTLSGVFAVFVLVQLRYLFAGGALPDGLTYASYAHRGYGQLLVATLLASAVVKYVVSALRESAQIKTRWLATTLVLLNSVVVLSAWKRLSLYETTYGWTLTRFVARLGLICILLGSVALVAWLWNRLSSKQLYTSSWYVLVGVLMTAAVLNPEGIIARKNITERPGRSVVLDTSYLTNLSADAWPAICATAVQLRNNHVVEYANLKSLHHLNVPTQNHGLSRHHTNTATYTQTYTTCLP